MVRVVRGGQGIQRAVALGGRGMHEIRHDAAQFHVAGLVVVVGVRLAVARQLQRSLFHLAGIRLHRLAVAQVVAGRGIFAPHAERGCRRPTAGKFRRDPLVAQFDQRAEVAVLNLPTTVVVQLVPRAGVVMGQVAIHGRKDGFGGRRAW